jgi:hypothetical protein
MDEEAHAEYDNDVKGHSQGAGSFDSDDEMEAAPLSLQ